MDDSISVKLTALFRDKSWKPPIDQQPFEVFFSNKTGTRMKFGMSTPEELSATLKHILSNQGTELFDRGSFFGVPEPIHVRMTIRDRCEETNKEHVRQAFVMAFRSEDEPCYLYWQKTPDNGYNGPSMEDFIHMLDKAENDWSRLNFMRTQGRPKLRLVHSAP